MLEITSGVSRLQGSAPFAAAGFQRPDPKPGREWDTSFLEFLKLCLIAACEQIALPVSVVLIDCPDDNSGTDIVRHRDFKSKGIRAEARHNVCFRPRQIGRVGLPAVYTVGIAFWL